MSVDCGKCVNRNHFNSQDVREVCYGCIYGNPRLTNLGVKTDNYEEGAPESGQPESPLNTQIGGDHYKKMGQYQPWEVLAKWMAPGELKGFMKGTVISYLAREEDKGGRADIEKAHHTLGLYLELTK